MASILKVDTLTGVATAGSIAVTGEGNSTTTNLQQGLAKAFVNLSGDGTVSIRDSHNTSSVTDNGTGDYTFAWSSSMGNINYTSSGAAGTNQDSLMNISQPENSSPPATGSCRFSVVYVHTTPFDGTYVGAVIHGDLA